LIFCYEAIADRVQLQLGQHVATDPMWPANSRLTISYVYVLSAFYSRITRMVGTS
jgi:hypothetical protein